MTTTSSTRKARRSEYAHHTSTTSTISTSTACGTALKSSASSTSLMTTGASTPASRSPNAVREKPFPDAQSGTMAPMVQLTRRQVALSAVVAVILVVGGTAGARWWHYRSYDGTSQEIVLRWRCVN